MEPPLRKALSMKGEIRGLSRTSDRSTRVYVSMLYRIISVSAAHFWAPIDPIGAIVIALWTGWSWGSTCYGMRLDIIRKCKVSLSRSAEKNKKKKKKKKKKRKKKKKKKKKYKFI